MNERDREKLKGAAMTAGAAGVAYGGYRGGQAVNRAVQSRGGYGAVARQGRDAVASQATRAGAAVRSGADRAGTAVRSTATRAGAAVKQGYGTASGAVSRSATNARGAAESAGRFASTKADEVRVKGRSLYQRGIQSGGQKLRNARAAMKKTARGYGKIGRTAAKFMETGPRAQRRLINLEAMLDDALGLE